GGAPRGSSGGEGDGRSGDGTAESADTGGMASGDGGGRDGSSISAGASRGVSITAATKGDPWAGVGRREGGSLARSPRALRKEEMFWVRLASVTKVSGQICWMRSSFGTTRPRFSKRAMRMENALGVREIDSPARDRRRRTGSARKPSNS